MINYVYQLKLPGFFSVKYGEVDLTGKVLLKPRFMALCHADRRYYYGKRELSILKKKLPMALIHECCGEVVYDSTGTFKVGQKAIMIPNIVAKDHQDYIYENYEKGSGFLSSGCDGFMRELVDLNPDRVVPFEKVDEKIAAIAEFVSCAVHAVSRLKKVSHKKRNSVGIWGDGSLAYVLACVISELMPETNIYIMGKSNFKLSQFSFVKGTYLLGEVPKDFEIDHAFECAGGMGSAFAVDDIIRYINPQGTAVLMGVSEEKILVNTRDILEKGLTLVGSSRSGREDFVKTVGILEKERFQKRLSRIVYQDGKVSGIADIHRVFETDTNTSFKTVFEWGL